MNETEKLVAEAIRGNDASKAIRLLVEAQLPENTVIRFYFEGGNICNLPVPVKLEGYHDKETFRIYVNFVVSLMQIPQPIRVDRVEIESIQSQ